MTFRMLGGGEGGSGVNIGYSGVLILEQAIQIYSVKYGILRVNPATLFISPPKYYKMNKPGRSVFVHIRVSLSEISRV
jgi:hypothetical protein